MILDKEMVVKITKKNIKHYIKFFFDIKIDDIININVELHLQKQSGKKINVKCDLCEEKRYINYQSYTRNISSCPKYPIYTCDKCSHIKLKEYNKTHYGVEYYSQHPDRNEKVRKTSLEKYGAKHFSKSSYFFQKVSKTNLEKFGFENPFMDKDRIKQIFNEKYGVNHPSQVEEFSNKMKITNVERYGVEFPLQSKEIRDKVNNTNMERYGGHFMKNDEHRYLNLIITKDENYISYEGNNISLFKCIAGHNFKISSELYHNRLRSNLPLCTICYPLNENISIKELELLKFIKTIYNGEIIPGYRDGLEIDIYLPDLKLGFEFNGLYWHSNKQKENNYHSDKTNYFKEKGIRIIHIWEDDWDFKTDIIKSQIFNRFKKSNKIYARNCQIIEIDKKLCKSFLDSNHLQGNINTIKRYGLIYNGELVSLMTFDKSEGRKKMDENGWNLSRFCNKKYTSIIGGASKLLNFFIKNNLPNRIITYADKDWSIGNLYEKLGFEKVSEVKYDYKYIIDNKRVHKSRYRKSKLKTNLSESKFMEISNIEKIYDCGKIKFEMLFSTFI